jgi:lipopolysaccharide export system protein LptA
VKIIFFILIIVANFELRAQEEPMVVNSGEAEYDGKRISLVGNVSIEHGLGKISAHRLSIEPDKKKRFAIFKMDQDVVIQLQTGGSLRCQNAQVDYSQLKGVFSGSTQQPDVIYTDTRPLILKSLQVQAEMGQQGDLKQVVLQHIYANEQVQVSYNQDYLLTADNASYACFGDKNKAGILALTAHDHCILTNQFGDRIHAKHIDVDTNKRLITFYLPRGVIVKEGRFPDPIHFICGELVWDDAQQMLNLQSDVALQMGQMGYLKTSHQVQLYQALINGHKAVRSLIAPQASEFTYHDSQDLVHTITCPGLLVIDREQVVLQGTKTDQVCFEDVLGDLYADQVQLDYKQTKAGLVPDQLMLQGNVKIFNRFDGHVQESGSVLQYALADSVQYDPEKKEMLLKSQNGKRVLFYDKANNVQMSASSLKIVRDGQSGKGAVQGIGDVRFTFMEHELDQLRQHFQLKENFK